MAGKLYTYSYDGIGRLTGEDSAPLRKRYQYFNTGRLSRAESGENLGERPDHQNWRQKVADYGYDLLGRLVSEKLTESYGEWVDLSGVMWGIPLVTSEAETASTGAMDTLASDPAVAMAQWGGDTTGTDSGGATWTNPTPSPTPTEPAPTSTDSGGTTWTNGSTSPTPTPTDPAPTGTDSGGATWTNPTPSPTPTEPTGSDGTTWGETSSTLDYWSYFPGSSVNQNATSEYDLLGRMTRYTEKDAAGAVLAEKNWSYDAKGNVRRIVAGYKPMDAGGNIVATGSTAWADHWYRYDSMDRTLVSKGVLGSGTITQGYAGVALTYDQAGRRTTSQTGYGLKEAYSYAPGTDRVASVAIGGVTRVSSSYDLLGRLNGHLERSYNGALVYERHSLVYNSRDQLLSEKGRRLLDSGKWHFTHTTSYFNDNGGGSIPGFLSSSAQVGTSSGTVLVGSLTKNWLAESSGYNPFYSSTGQTTSSTEDGKWADTRSTYGYDWVAPAGAGGGASVAGPRQVTQRLSNRDGETLATRGFGNEGAIETLAVTRVSGTARTYTQSYATDMAGQVLRRTQTDSVSGAEPQARTYRFGGVEMGELGNDGTDNVDYNLTIARRDDEGSGPFRGGAKTGQVFADFDLNHRTLAANRRPQPEGIFRGHQGGGRP